VIPPSWPQYLNSQKDCKLDLLGTAFLITSFVTLFVIIDPIGLTPVFVTLTQGMPSQQRRNIGLRATLVAAFILCIFCLFGESVLEFVGISMPAFQIAGGILLFLIALDMLFERRSKRRKSQSEEDDQNDDISVFPLAIPLLAGPGSITSIILIASTIPGWIGVAHAILAMLGVIVIAYVMFLTGPVLERMLGRTGINVVTRILGMILAALAVQFVMDGFIAFTVQFNI
jgi:multiple antibiotic resistance protein